MSNSGFIGVEEFGTSLVGDQIESNVCSWLQWGLLNVGAFHNVELDTAAIYGVRSPAKLRPVDDPRDAASAGYTYKFQGVRSDWVWESGLDYHEQPVGISGVWASGQFVPSNSTGSYAHTINYPMGIVQFASQQPTGLDVKVEHSFRHTQIRRASEPWFQEFSYRSFRNDEDFDAPPGSGGRWELLGENRIQLPAIVVEVLDNVRLKPYEMGSTKAIHQQPCLLHVISETPWERRRLHDILISQYDRKIDTFDCNEITPPLDYNGSPVSGAKTHPLLLQERPWLPIRIANVESTNQEEIGNKLFWTTVRYTLEVDAP